MNQSRAPAAACWLREEGGLPFNPQPSPSPHSTPACRPSGLQLGDHLSALRVLALTLRDIGAAEAYAAAHLPPSEYRTLLQLVLHPGPGIEPLYEDACYLITALGGFEVLVGCCSGWV